MAEAEGGVHEVQMAVIAMFGLYCGEAESPQVLLEQNQCRTSNIQLFFSFFLDCSISPYARSRNNNAAM